MFTSIGPEGRHSYEEDGRIGRPLRVRLVRLASRARCRTESSGAVAQVEDATLCWGTPPKRTFAGIMSLGQLHLQIDSQGCRLIGGCTFQLSVDCITA
jgi:hypothetical protein